MFAITSKLIMHMQQEKPQVLTAIANASSAANNLINAITVGTFPKPLDPSF